MKTIQQRFALSVALYILQENGISAPKKRQVLNFIRSRGFLRFPDAELQKRWLTDSDEIWENDIAWKRKDLFMDGEIDSPEWGHWRLTKTGAQKIEAAKAKWQQLADETKRTRFLKECDYFTPTFVEWLLKIARGESLSLKLQPKPNVIIQTETLPTDG